MLRIELQDFIGVYSINSSEWTELCKFKCKGNLNNVNYIGWSPVSSHIIAIDSYLNYKLAIYSPSGEVISTCEPYQNALGFKQIFSSTSFGQYIALGSYDGKIRLFSTVSWQMAFELPLMHSKDMHPGLISSKTSETNSTGFCTTVEVTDPSGTETVFSNIQEKAVNSTTVESCYVYRNLKNLPKLIIDPNYKGIPKLGVTGMSISHDGNYLSAREESSPRCLWIWDIKYIYLFYFNILFYFFIFIICIFFNIFYLIFK